VTWVSTFVLVDFGWLCLHSGCHIGILPFYANKKAGLLNE